jgi:predicted MFS family arabinose efflux permease
MNPWKGLRGLPSAMWVLALSTLVNRMGTMVVFFLALYLVQDRGWTEAQAATALALNGLGALVASPFSGWAADRIGHRRTLAWSLGLSGVLLLALPFARERLVLLALIPLWAGITQAYWPASAALIADLVPAADRKQAFVLHRLASNLGIAVGPALGGLVAQVAFSAIFWIDGLTTLAGMAVLLAGLRAPTPAPGGRASASAWRDRRLLVFLATLLPGTLVFTQIHGSLPLWVCRGLGHRTATFGLLLTLNTVIILALEVDFNRRLASWTHGRQLALGAAFIGLAFGSLAFLRTLPLLAVAMALLTFGEMAYLPASADAVAALAPPDRRGEYLGLYSLTWTLAMTLGPWLGLLAYARPGPPFLWAACAVLGLGGAAAVLPFRQNPGT